MRMKSTVFIFVTSVFILGSVLVLLNKETEEKNKKNKEGFVPVLHHLYRPHIRNARLYGTKLVERLSNHLYVFSKRRGWFH